MEARLEFVEVGKVGGHESFGHLSEEKCGSWKGMGSVPFTFPHAGVGLFSSGKEILLWAPGAKGAS